MIGSTKTFLESLDPRTKFFGLVLIGIQTLFSKSVIALSAIAILSIISIIASPITTKALLTTFRRVFWFVFVITLINTFTITGEVVFEVSGKYGTAEGLREGLFLSSRVVLLLFLSTLFVHTTSIPDMLDGIEAALSPFRKHFNPFILLLNLTLNFVPTLIQSSQQIKAAQIARGADVESSFFKQVRFAASAALPLFVSAFRSSLHLAQAMDARCFDTTQFRTPFHNLKMNWRDWTTLSFLVLLSAALLFWV